MRFTYLFSLLLGALFLTMGCEPEQADDDDDIMADDDDDDVTDDDDTDPSDDDDTAEDFALYISTECDGIEGMNYPPAIYVDDVQIESSPMTLLLPRGHYKLQAKGDFILSPIYEYFDVSEDNEMINLLPDNEDLDGEIFLRCGLAPQGVYRAYEDEECTIPDPGNYTYLVETKIDYWNGEPDQIVMENLIVDQVVWGSDATDYFEALDTHISGDLQLIHIGGTNDYFYCPE